MFKFIIWECHSSMFKYMHTEICPPKKYECWLLKSSYCLPREGCDFKNFTSQPVPLTIIDECEVRKHAFLIILTSTEHNLQQFQSYRSEYNHIAHKKEDIMQKQLRTGTFTYSSCYSNSTLHIIIKFSVLFFS